MNIPGYNGKWNRLPISMDSVMDNIIDNIDYKMVIIFCIIAWATRWYFRNLRDDVPTVWGPNYLFGHISLMNKPDFYLNLLEYRYNHSSYTYNVQNRQIAEFTS